MTQRPPILFRLMLCTLFMPIMLALGAMLYAIHVHLQTDMWIDPHSIMLGVPVRWCFLAMCLFPFLLWFWMFWSGNWRRPVLTAGIFYLACLIVAEFQLIETETVRIPPDKRIINFSGIEGTEIYCNGVLLGKIEQQALEIRVGELKAKVPEWASPPPEQRWYDDSEPGQFFCTWAPLDAFLEDRFEAAKKRFDESNQLTTGKNVVQVRVAQRELLNKYIADCRFWWSGRLGDSQLAFPGVGYGAHSGESFDKETGYFYSITFSPSAFFHAQLLIDVLPELTPEQQADWNRHVLANMPLLRHLLLPKLWDMARRYRQQNNDLLAQSYDNAYNTIALLYHGISGSPTEEDARRLLTKWTKETYTPQNSFSFESDYHRGFVWTDIRVSLTNALIPDAIHEVMRKPLVEQWATNKYRWDIAWAPVAYFSSRDKSPDVFDGLARYSATTHVALRALLENESPLTTALFKTLLYRRSMDELLSRQIDLYEWHIRRFSRVINPLVEAEFRDYIAKALADPKLKEADTRRNDINRAVADAIFERINREGTDMDNLAHWVISLPIESPAKNLALRMIRIRRSDEGLTFADRLQQAAGDSVMIETELTLDDVTNWFAGNPEGNLEQFLVEHGESISVSGVRKELTTGNFYHSQFSGPISLAQLEANKYSMWDNLPSCFVRALLRSDTPEGNQQVHDIIRLLWKSDNKYVVDVIKDEHSATYLDFSPGRFLWTTFNSILLPDYILDLLLESGPVNATLAPMLAICDSPKSGEILEKWVSEASTTAARLPVERGLELWRTRSAVRQRKMEAFQELVAGRMSPDDLLLQQPAWVWKDGEYVQK